MKAQFCLQQVKYLDLILVKGTRTPARKEYSLYWLFFTLRHLNSCGGSLESSAFANYGSPDIEIARPLYTLVKETQRANTHLVEWEPEAETAFQTLKEALVQTPALSLPTGQNVSLYIMERAGIALGVLT